MERVSSLRIDAPAEMPGRWGQLSKGRPVRLEIGCGKGRFICDTAEQSPGVFFAALEKITDVLVMALEKALDRGLENVRFLRGDAGQLGEWFAQGEVDRIYLNFSDPWPANRHKARRLTAEGFLSIYRRILSPQGSIHFKTDNRDLFEFSVKEFTRCGWSLQNVTRDLHGEGAEPGIGGAVTEYEQRFMELGVPILRLEAYPPQ